MKNRASLPNISSALRLMSLVMKEHNRKTPKGIAKGIAKGIVSDTPNTESTKRLANAQIQFTRNWLSRSLSRIGGGGSAKSAAVANPPPPPIVVTSRIYSPALPGTIRGYPWRQALHGGFHGK